MKVGRLYRIWGVFAVLAGQFRITMGGKSVVLGPGDAVEVPRGAEHSAEVIGDETVVSLDAVEGNL